MNWRRAGDVGLWAVLGFLVVAESGTRGDPYWVHASCLTVLAAAVLVRRTVPLVALGLVAGAEVVILAVTLGTSRGVPVAMIPAMVLLAYLAGRRETQLRHFVLLTSWTLIALLVLGVVVQPDSPVTEAVLTWLVVVLVSLVLVVLPWLIGRYRAQQALLATAGWERAERIEREQRMEIDQARLLERSRIAEDMHDSVGHELSLIALRAAALEVATDLPDRHRRAATELREAAAAATDRLGEIIGVLRDAEAQAPVVPSHESVADLVERAAASGLSVHLTQRGSAEPSPTSGSSPASGLSTSSPPPTSSLSTSSPPLASDPPQAVGLSPMVDRAIHRVVQESLTNASKHAPGAEVTVTVEQRADEVEVRVVDTGASRPVPDGVPSTGRGLAGLTERVRLVGGTLSAGPRDTGGFEVVARIPPAGGPPEPEPPPSSATADERATVRRRARRGLIMAVTVPVILACVIGLVAMGYYLLAGYNSILPPASYDALRVGQPVAEVERVLPAMEMIDPPSERTPAPAAWNCRYYRPDGPFSINYAYRLCFADGRLVAKTVVQTGSVQPTTEVQTGSDQPATEVQTGSVESPTGVQTGSVEPTEVQTGSMEPTTEVQAGAVQPTSEGISR